MKKKKPLKRCRKCNVELSWKEDFNGTLCFVCDRQEFEKDMRFSDQHGDAHREGQRWIKT